MTSYIICRKRLGIKKSDIELLKKSVEDRKLEYFKSELLKILDKKEKEEESEEVSKAFIVQDLYKSMTDPLYMAKGGKVGVVGEIRTWNGKKYKKMPNKKWVRVYDKETRGAKLAIAALRRKIDACTDSRELLNLVLANKDRFCDELGRPLPIVQELSKYVSAKNDSIESLGNKKQDKAKKKGALKVLNKQEIHDFIEKHKTSKVNERVSLGAISDDARNRIKAATGIDVERVILDSDSIRHSFIPKHNLEENDLDDMKEIIDTTTDISLSHDKNSMGNPVIIFKKQEPNGVILCEEYRAGKKELELQTAYRVKKNRQPLSAENQPLANVQNVTAPTNNVAHNNAVVNKTVKIDIKDFPEQFGKGKWKKQTKILMDFMNGTSGDSTVKSLYKKLGAMINNLPFKIAKPKQFANGQFSVSCDRRTMKPVEQTLHLLDISDENENIRRDTCMKALHEIMHMVDFSCRENKDNPEYASVSNAEITNAIENAKISDEEIKELGEHFAAFRAKEKEAILRINEKVREVKELQEQYNRGTITKFDEYAKKYKEVKSQYDNIEKEIKELRAKEADAAIYSDILDAISGGELHDEKSFGGHGKAYYRNKGNRNAETVANYAALLASGSVYADKVKKNFPEIAESVYNLYKKMLER